MSALGLARKCGHCKKWHKGECWGLIGACYKCGAMDHRVKNCPKGKLPQTRIEKLPPTAQSDSRVEGSEATGSTVKLAIETVGGPEARVTSLANVTQAREE